MGGHVRKGEHGTTVVYADRFIPDDEKKRATETGEEAQAIPFLKRFTVFNIDQCDGLPEQIATVAPPPPPGTIEPRVEALIKATGIEFRIGGSRAFYIPSQDYVQVPPPAAYFEPINWHRTALHELGHASGHRSRLNRDLSGTHGSKKYAFEELIAELRARVLLRGEGIETVLSLRCVMPDMPMEAALSAAHLAAILFPATLRRLYVVRDNDPAGDGAMAGLFDRAHAARIEAIALSPQGDDFNDDLRRFGIDALRAAVRVQLVPEDVARFMPL